MKRLLPPPLILLVLTMVGVCVLITGCAGSLDEAGLAGLSHPPCLTTTKAIAVAQNPQGTADYLQVASDHTPCLTAAKAASSKTQTVLDVAGDVTSGVNGPAPPTGLESLGDITVARLIVTEANVILEIETAAPLPQCIPADIDSIRYSLMLSIEDQVLRRMTEYTVSAIQVDDQWTASVDARRAEEAVARQLNLDLEPVVSDGAIYLAVPLAAMSDFASNFRWAVESTWAHEGINYSDTSPVLWFTQ